MVDETQETGTVHDTVEDAPECTDSEGHIWTAGRAEVSDEGVMEPVTDRCHICGCEVKR